MISKKDNTGWGEVAFWYDDFVETGSNYQKEVILPDILSILSIKNGDKVLDLACGQGFFARALRDAGARVIGVDLAKELIDIAKNYEKAKKIGGPTSDFQADKIEYFTAPSHKMDFIPSESIDKVTLILALQNIEKVGETLNECQRVLRSGGSLVMVLNHPVFRIPKESSWGFDEASSVQYRRVDRYMSEFKVSINMHPGQSKPSFTESFHRPMQFYFKVLKSTGFLTKTLHELISNKISQPGKRANAENQSKKEIPLFMLLEAVKV